MPSVNVYVCLLAHLPITLRLTYLPTTYLHNYLPTRLSTYLLICYLLIWNSRDNVVEGGVGPVKKKQQKKNKTSEQSKSKMRFFSYVVPYMS